MRPYQLLAVSIALLAGTAACTDPNALPAADVPNFVDTLSLGSLSGTSIGVPSGFAVAKPHAVRTDGDIVFDFVFDVDTVGGAPRAVFYPPNALGLNLSGAAAGLALSTVPFDSMTVAPNSGYVTDSAVVVSAGQSYYVRSRNTSDVCPQYLVPTYAKIEILSVEDQTITLRALSDNNCGYRGLETGLPTR